MTSWFYSNNKITGKDTTETVAILTPPPEVTREKVDFVGQLIAAAPDMYNYLREMAALGHADDRVKEILTKIKEA